MVSIQLINLYSSIFALINNSAISSAKSLIMPYISILFTLFILTTFHKYKNLLLDILSPATNSNIVRNNTLTI